MKFLLLCLFVFIFIPNSIPESCQYSFPSIIRIDDFRSTPTSYWYCDIYNGTETDFIKDAIRNCTTCEYTHKTTIFFYLFTSEPVDLVLDIGPSITDVMFDFSSSSSVQISSFKVHSFVTRLIFDISGIVPQSNFFSLFPNVESVSFSQNLTFNSVPTFNNLKLLSLTARISVTNGFVLNRNFTQGLESLQYLYVLNSGITSVSTNAFAEMGDLIILSLENNLISYLKPQVFQGLSNLIQLNLRENQITTASPDSFNGLNSLTYLTVAMNTNFPVYSLRELKSLRTLDINSNGYTNLNPFPFQQLNQLTYIRLSDNPFKCDCELQWLSMVSMHGVSIQGGVCVSPLGSSVSSVSTYANCTALEFGCFNKSIECPSNQVCQNGILEHYCCCPQNFRMTDSGECVAVPQCHNSIQTIADTLDGCGCDIGYTLSIDCSVCVDINECGINNGGCEQNCVNTIGSRVCTCNYGYRLVNLTFCEDIDECLSSLLECSGYCENTVGSYNCRCWNGYQQTNVSSCSNINECDVDNGNCEQMCYNTSGSYFCGCYVGYNYTIGNLNFCHLETQYTVSPAALDFNWSNPTIVIAAVCIIVVLIILLICQTIVCLVIICWKKHKHFDEAIELKPIRKVVNTYNDTENNNNNNTENNNNNTIETLNTSYVDMHSKYYTLNSSNNKKEHESPYVESTHYEHIPVADTLDRDGGAVPIVYGQFDASIVSDYENVAFNH